MKSLSAEQKMALWAIIPVGIANAILTFIFFFIAIGSISYVFGWATGTALSVTISACLGIGFVVGEALIHWFDPEGWEGRITNYAILALLMAINWGAGFYRAQDNITNNRINAVEMAAKDPRYSSLLDEKQNLERNVLADGKVGNDEMAIARQTAITAELGKIVEEYRTEANGAKGSTMSLAIISLALIAVNIIFGKSVKSLRKLKVKVENESETKVTKPRNVSQVDPVSKPQVALKPQAAFEVVSFDDESELSDIDAEILRLWDGGLHNKAEIGRRVGKSHTHVGNVVKGRANTVKKNSRKKK